MINSELANQIPSSTTKRRSPLRPHVSPPRPALQETTTPEPPILSTFHEARAETETDPVSPSQVIDERSSDSPIPSTIVLNGSPVPIVPPESNLERVQTPVRIVRSHQNPNYFVMKQHGNGKE